MYKRICQKKLKKLTLVEAQNLLYFDNYFFFLPFLLKPLLFPHLNFLSPIVDVCYVLNYQISPLNTFFYGLSSRAHKPFLYSNLPVTFNHIHLFQSLSCGAREAPNYKRFILSFVYLDPIIWAKSHNNFTANFIYNYLEN